MTRYRTRRIAGLSLYIIFPPTGAHPYKRDLHNLDFHLLDTGHFALEDHADFIAERIKQFAAGVLKA